METKTLISKDSFRKVYTDLNNEVLKNIYMILVVGSENDLDAFGIDILSELTNLKVRLKNISISVENRFEEDYPTISQVQLDDLESFKRDLNNLLPKEFVDQHKSDIESTYSDFDKLISGDIDEVIDHLEYWIVSLTDLKEITDFLSIRIPETDPEMHDIMMNRNSLYMVLDEFKIQLPIIKKSRSKNLFIENLPTDIVLATTIASSFVPKISGIIGCMPRIKDEVEQKFPVFMGLKTQSTDRRLLEIRLKDIYIDSSQVKDKISKMRKEGVGIPLELNLKINFYNQLVDQISDWSSKTLTDPLTESELDWLESEGKLKELNDCIELSEILVNGLRNIVGEVPVNESNE